MSKVKIEKGHKSLGLFISSGGGEYSREPRVVLECFRRHISIRIPPIIKPECKKVEAKYWDADTIARMGRDWYWDITERRYGFYLFEGHFYVYLGRHTMDSSTTQKWSCFLPWTQWRFVRHSLYRLDGSHICDLPQGSWKGLGDEGWRARYDAEQAAKDAQPKAYYAFTDYDGERIKARCRVEEREWRFGTGWWRWLSLFRARKVDRSLDLEFSSEVGRRKGSWKGGMVGHSISMSSGESVEAAFRRYCEQQKLGYIGPCEPWKREYAEQDAEAAKVQP